MTIDRGCGSGVRGTDRRDRGRLPRAVAALVAAGCAISQALHPPFRSVGAGAAGAARRVVVTIHRQRCAAVGVKSTLRWRQVCRHAAGLDRIQPGRPPPPPATTSPTGCGSLPNHPLAAGGEALTNVRVRGTTAGGELGRARMKGERRPGRGGEGRALARVAQNERGGGGGGGGWGMDGSWPTKRGGGGGAVVVMRSRAAQPAATRERLGRKKEVSRSSPGSEAAAGGEWRPPPAVSFAWFQQRRLPGGGGVIPSLQQQCGDGQGGCEPE